MIQIVKRSINFIVGEVMILYSPRRRNFKLLSFPIVHIYYFLLQNIQNFIMGRGIFVGRVSLGDMKTFCGNNIHGKWIQGKFLWEILHRKRERISCQNQKNNHKFNLQNKVGLPLSQPLLFNPKNDAKNQCNHCEMGSRQC